jgi:hypothetical protein
VLSTNGCLTGLPDGIFSNRKIPIFGKSWYILWPFGIFYGQLVYLMTIWHILWAFGMLHQEKSGNAVVASKNLAGYF